MRFIVNMLNNFRIKNKIIALVFGIGALATIAGNGVNFIYEIQNAKAQLVANTILQAKLIAENCWLPLEFNYKKSASEVLQKFYTIPNIRDAVLYSDNGSVFASYHVAEDSAGRIPLISKDTTSFLDREYLHVKQPVRHLDKLYGYIYIRSYVNWAGIVNQRIVVSSVISLCMLILIYVLAYFMQHLITSPLIILADEMHSIATTKKYSVQLQTAGSDEIADLYREFNTMLYEINRKDSELRAAFESVKEGEEKLSTLFSAMAEMVVLHEIVCDEHGTPINYRMTDCNKSFTQVTGMKNEDVQGKLITEVYNVEHPPHLEEYARVAVTQEPYHHNTYDALLDKHFTISVVSPRKDHFATIAMDITAIQQIQNVISEKNKELENYLYVASHDMRSPLVNIQGFSQRMLKQVDSIRGVLDGCGLDAEAMAKIDTIVNDKIRRSMDFIFINVTKMDALINGLLQISRTGKMKMSIQKINMNQLFKKIVDAYNFQITEYSVRIDLCDVPACCGDENLLNQLFSNIIGNAIKYRDALRPLIINISARELHNKVVYSIKDTSIGIAERHIEKIWNVFYRVDSSAPETGDGIGLSLAKRIADKHKGKIWVESEVGTGSIFHIELQKQIFSE